MELTFLKYNVPFNKPFHTASGIYKDRRGVFIILKKNNITAFGEAAPLPGFSVESLPALIDEIQQNRKKVEQLFHSDSTLNDLEQMNFSASLQFGLFSAAALYLAQKKELSLHQFLFENSRDEVKINAVIDLKKENVLPQIHQYTKEGFDTVKVKTGINWNTTISQLKIIRCEFEGVNIRLDANRNWSLEKAKYNLKEAEPYRIQYCEEPLKDPSPQKLKALKDYTAIPIALDETMAKWAKVKERAEIANVLIIKPMVIGGNKKIKEIHDFAVKNNKELIFTSSLGTGIESLTTATLAAGLGSRKLAHGLNTVNLLQKDVWNDDQFIKNGKYKLPDYEHLKLLMQSYLQRFSTEII